MTTYAIIPVEHWKDELVERFPHAPLMQNYRVLVFADRETEQLKNDYERHGLVDAHDAEAAIELMMQQNKYWVICKVELLREVMHHFNPPEELTQD